VSRKRKAKRRLEQSRKREDLKQRLKLGAKRQAIAAERLELARKAYENAMIELWCDANQEQRSALEEIYQKTTGGSLRTIYEQRIVAALQKSAARRL
jgi:hypothetical protein